MAQIVWNNFLGGLSIDARVGQNGSYFKGEGVNVTERANTLQKGFRLTKAQNIEVQNMPVAVAEKWIFSSPGNYFAIDVLDDSETSIAHTFSRAGYRKVADLAIVMQNTSSAPGAIKRIFYAYHGNTNSDIGRADATTDLLTNESNSWLSKSGRTLSHTATKLASVRQKLLIKDFNAIDVWDGTDDSYKEDALTIEDEIKFMRPLGEWAVIVGKNNKIYVWDTVASSWANSPVQVGANILEGREHNGVFYFLTQAPHSADRNYLILHRLSEDFNSSVEITKIPFHLDGGTMLTPSMDTNPAGLHIAIPKSDGTNTEIFIYRWGGLPGMASILTCEGYHKITSSAVANGQGVLRLRPDSVEEGVDEGYYQIKTTNSVNSFKFNTQDLNAAFNEFQTIEQRVPDAENQFLQGKADKLAIDYETNDTASVYAIFDSTSYTIATSENFPASKTRKIFDLKGQKFRRVRIKITDGLPMINKISLKYEPVEDYGT